MYGEKLCNKCGHNQPITAFYKNKSTRDKFETVCKSCFKERANLYYQNNKEAILKGLSENWINSKNRYLKKKYGLDLHQYTQMYKNQNGKCLICSTAKELFGKHCHQLVVDHDHNNGKVRGLLCSECNKALGLFYDNPQLLNNAANYLTEHNT